MIKVKRAQLFFNLIWTSIYNPPHHTITQSNIVATSVFQQVVVNWLYYLLYTATNSD
jgi:hypothetical protein